MSYSTKLAVPQSWICHLYFLRNPTLVVVILKEFRCFILTGRTPAQESYYYIRRVNFVVQNNKKLLITQFEAGMGDSRWLYNRIASARQTENSKKRCFVWSPTAHIEYTFLPDCFNVPGISDFKKTWFNSTITTQQTKSSGFCSPEVTASRKTIEFKKSYMARDIRGLDALYLS